MSYHKDRAERERATGVIPGLHLILLGFLLFCLPTFLWASASGRFFLAGDGTILIRNAKTGKEANVRLFAADGSLNEEGFNRIDEVFGFPTVEKGEHISPRLICMLDYFSDRVAPGKAINLDSGYRSPQYNSTIRNAGGNVAKTSQHIDGMALDFNIAGVDGKALWEEIKDRDCCGVGYYGGTDIHLDSARPRFWEAATSKVGTGESDYNRRIYLSTNFDRYRPGEKMRLSLSAVSNFSFGVNRVVRFVKGDSETVATAPIIGDDATDCLMIDNRKASRFIFINLPAALPMGRYRIGMDFCNRPFPEMPTDTLSNAIEVLGRSGGNDLPSSAVKQSY
jgi:uncharacterized protein YcbK (DUF882 family)